MERTKSLTSNRTYSAGRGHDKHGEVSKLGRPVWRTERPFVLGIRVHSLQKPLLSLGHVQNPTLRYNAESRNELNSFNVIYFHVTSLINGLQR